MKLHEFIHKKRLTVASVANALHVTPARIYRYNTEKIDRLEVAKKIAAAMTECGKETSEKELIVKVDCFSSLKGLAKDYREDIDFMDFIGFYGITAKALANELHVLPRKIKSFMTDGLPLFLTLQEVVEALERLGMKINRSDLIFFFEDIPKSEKNRRALEVLQNTVPAKRRCTPQKPSRYGGEGNVCWNCWKINQCPNAGRNVEECETAQLYHLTNWKALAESLGVNVNKAKKILFIHGAEYFEAFAKERGVDLQVIEEERGPNDMVIFNRKGED